MNDNIRKDIVDHTRLRLFGKDISGRQFLPWNYDDNKQTKEPSLLKRFNEANKRSRDKQAITMDYLYRHKDIIEPTIAQYGNGDIGYSIGALRVASSNNIIKPNMSVKEVAKIMEEKNLAPYGFKLDESILNEVFNPFTKNLPLNNTMSVKDFR